MSNNIEDPLLAYYHRELSYLRHAGAAFAQKHPKIARRLELSQNESADPHVERLLESFAFLTAKLSRDLDDRFPRVASSLLQVLYPQLVNPIPSMAIAYFKVDPNKKATQGTLVPQGTEVFTYAEDGVTCRFQTGYDTTLWPLEVIHADFIKAEHYKVQNTTLRAPWYLRLKIKTLGTSFTDMGLNRLCFYIRGDPRTSFSIYEALFAQTYPQTLISLDGKSLQPLPFESLDPLGLNAKSVLPLPAYAHPSYQLIQEYFHFPEKFLFFEVKNLDAQHLNYSEADSTIELLFSLSDPKFSNTLSIQAENFLLGCTPIINLFPKITDPFRLDHRHLEYRLVPDQRRERTTEIHSILKVESITDGQTDPVVIHPYFSFSHEAHTDPQKSTFWMAKRVPTSRKDLEGTDMVLSFMDLAFNPRLAENPTVYAYTLCTNRFLASQIPAGAALYVEEKLPISRIVCLEKPSAQVYPSEDGETLWQLISQLSVNHLSLTQPETGLEALKETLRLHARSGTGASICIEAIESMKARSVVRRMGHEAWRGFVQGVGIDLTLHDRLNAGLSSFLFASLLRSFFALQVSCNSFVELSLYRSDHKNLWMQWAPLKGDQILL